jgi:N4-gp56 family major capsid protein
METLVNVGDPKAIKRWSARLAVETLGQSFWNRRMIGDADTFVIQQKTELEDGPGDRVSFDLSVQLRGTPTRGDNRLQGNGENLRFFTDEVIIDMLRKATTVGGKMTRKRTLHNLRSIAKARLSDYWSKYMDETMFIYLSGARGMNEDYIEAADFAGHADNPIQSPDGQHILYGGGANSKATITADVNDGMTRELIERAVAHAKMMRALDPEAANMQPVMVDGSPHYVTVMGPFQEYQLRNNAGTSGWLDIQKAAASSEGRNNAIFKGGLGMINNVVLQCHESSVRFADYGAGANIPAGRALFLGRQAGVVAYGTSGGSRMSWTEEDSDHKNQLEIAGGSTFGMKKTRFNSRDFGVLALDTYAPLPVGS